MIKEKRTLKNILISKVQEPKRPNFEVKVPCDNRNNSKKNFNYEIVNYKSKYNENKFRKNNNYKEERKDNIFDTEEEQLRINDDIDNKISNVHYRYKKYCYPDNEYEYFNKKSLFENSLKIVNNRCCPIVMINSKIPLDSVSKAKNKDTRIKPNTNYDIKCNQVSINSKNFLSIKKQRNVSIKQNKKENNNYDLNEKSNLYNRLNKNEEYNEGIYIKKYNKDLNKTNRYFLKNKKPEIEKEKNHETKIGKEGEFIEKKNDIRPKSRISTTNPIEILEKKIKYLEGQNKLINDDYSLLKNEKNNLEKTLISKNEEFDQLFKENQELKNKNKYQEKELKNLEKILEDKKIMLQENAKVIIDYKRTLNINKNKILSFESINIKNNITIKNKDLKIRELENIIEKCNNKISELENWKKAHQNILDDNKQKINEKENEIKYYKSNFSMLEAKKTESQLLIQEKDKKIQKLDLLISNLNNQILSLQENEKNINSILNERNDIIKINKEKINSLEEKIKILLTEKYNSEKKLENIIKNKDGETSNFKKKISEIEEKNKNEIQKYKDIICQLEKKNKENEDLLTNRKKNISEEKLENINFVKEPLKKINSNYNNLQFKQEEISNGICDNNKELPKNKNIQNEEIKIYGFRNNCNDCYLNSSLQLLTRINDLKNGIYNYEKKYLINEDTDTNGKLFIEFKKILNKIENSKDNDLIIDPKPLKNIMGNLDEKYYENNQEDANEFISIFIDGLRMETLNKLKEKEINKFKNLKINDELIRNAYDSFFNRFYLKRGYSFLLDIFYGILLSKIYCKSCNETTLKFNPYNMLELPIIQMANNNKKKSLELNMILKVFRDDKKYEGKCEKCNTSKYMYTKTLLYTFPKYLMICFGRTVGNEYIYNNIIYDKNLELTSDYDNKKYNYSIECVLEHSGGAHYGHYSALCPKDKNNNCWYRFSDSYCDKTDIGFRSKNALILLYKLNE